MSYVTLAGSSFLNKSVTVRGFIPDYFNTNISGFNRLYHSPTYLTYFSGGSGYSNQPFQEGWQVVLSGGTGGPTIYLDTFPQSSIDNYEQGVSAGLGTPALDSLIQYGLISGSSICVPDVIGNNSWLPGLKVTTSGTAIVSSDPFTSSQTSDNILAPIGLSNIGTAGQYYFQMAMWSFPGSSLINVASSNIQFSDARGSSITIPFNSALITYPPPGTATLSNGGGYASITGGTGLTIRIDAASVNATVDLTQMRGVTFNLVGAGTANYTFKASQLKLVGSAYADYRAGAQTRIGTFQLEEWPGYTQPTFGTVLLDNYSAYNYTYVTKFNAGHAYSGGTSNQFSVYLRVNSDRAGHANDYLKVQVQATNSQTIITAWDGGTAGTAQTQIYTQSGASLGSAEDYALVVSLQDNKFAASIYDINQFIYDSTFIQGSSHTTYAASTGYVGYDFAPLIGDFSIDYMYAKDIILGQYVSKTFNSNLPVTAVSLYAQSSPPNNIISFGSVNQDGSPTINFGLNNWEQIHNLQPSPPTLDTPDNSVSSTAIMMNGLPTLQVTKNISTAYIAGVTYKTLLNVNSPSSLTITGNLRYDGVLDNTIQETNLQGGFRLVLWDKWLQNPIYLEEITGLTPNKWNTFSTEVIGNIYTNQVYLEIQHSGTATNIPGSANYYLNNVQVFYRGINWDASNNGGTTWIPFYNNINDPYKGINFPMDGAVHNQLKIRARAYTLDSWINGYQATPQYARPGLLHP